MGIPQIFFCCWFLIQFHGTLEEYCTTTFLWNVLRLILQSSIWSENVSSAPEMNMISAIVWWNILHVSITLHNLLLFFKSSISLLSFCLDFLSVIKSGILKSPTIIILLFTFSFNLSVSFPIFEDGLDEYAFIIVMYYWHCDCFIIIKHPSTDYSILTYQNLGEINTNLVLVRYRVFALI